MNLIMTVGVPGSGKSTWVREFVKANPNYFVICRDDIRTMGGAGAYVFDKDKEPTLLMMSRNMLNEAVEAGWDVVLDEIMIMKRHRQEIRNMLRATGIVFGKEYKIKIVYFDVDLETCISRRCADNKNSAYNWDEIIRGMSARLEPPTADECDELIKEVS